MTKEQLQRNYEIRQQNWIKANNLEPGDKVKVLKSYPSHKGGWRNSWENDVMNKQIGNILKIRNFEKCQGILLQDGFSYPYTVLQKIEE